MGNAALKLVNESDLQAQARAARAEVIKKNKAAEDAEAGRLTAERNFERAPSADTHSAAAIAAQIAKNARREASEYTAKIAPLLQSARVEREESDLRELTEQIREDVAVKGARDQLLDLIQDTRRKLRGALLDLGDAVGRSNQLRGRAANLCETLGRPAAFRALSRDGLVAEITESQRTDDYSLERVQLFVSEPGSGQDVVTLTLATRIGGAP